MKNTYLFISLLCIIILNCYRCAFVKRKREGFKFDDINPVKLIDKVLGKIIDGLLGSVPILKDIHEKVKKKVGLFEKIGSTFYEMFISSFTIIFLSLGALACLYLGNQVFSLMLANIHLLFQPNSLLKDI